MSPYIFNTNPNTHRIGEKFLEWSDEDPSLEHILESVTLYWMTDTFPRCIYPYRGVSPIFIRPAPLRPSYLTHDPSSAVMSNVPGSTPSRV